MLTDAFAPPLLMGRQRGEGGEVMMKHGQAMSEEQ
jgi:hypothetical protein